MGALTDNRKRRFLDLCLPSPPPHPVSPLSSDVPSKKPKIAAPPSPPPSAPLLRRFPPAAPLPRPLHGPQRILRAFRLGSAAPDRPLQESSERDSEMGGFFSRFLRRKKKESPAGSAGDQRSDEDVGLGLEEYKKLVVGVQEGHSPAEVALVQLSFSPGVSDLTVVTQEKATAPAAVVNRRKVEDARQVALEAAPRVERQASARKVPVYKELYEESARKHDSRLSSLDFEVRLAEKTISGLHLAAEIAEKKPKEDLRGLFTPLTEEEEGEIDYAMRGGRSGQVLVRHEPSNIEITREVLQCLGNGAWLNDEVINLYLELLKEREKREPKKFLKCHFFNTFFYKKLISGKNGYDYKAVRRWTTQRKIGYGLIECDKIFVPIHKEVHWCLAIIDVKDEKLQYLDSLGGIDKSVLRVLARYFIDEVKDKSDREVDMTSWKLETIEGLPLQKNGWDCGMFMLKYTDFFSRGLGLCFGQEHMAYFRKRTAKEILRLKAD